MTMNAITRSPMETYREHLRRGELAYQFSPAAGRPVFYPRLVCPFTGTRELEWRVSAGRGTIHAVTVAAHRDAPERCIVLVDLDEGFRMLSRVDDVRADAVAIGDRVQVRIEQTDPDWDGPYPTFVLTGPGR